MGTLRKTAANIEEIYYSGNVQYLGDKLQYGDFLQFLSVKAGKHLRLQFYEQLQLDGDVGSFLSSMLSFKLFEVTTLGSGIKIVEQEIYMVPRSLGIFGVYPVLEGCAAGDEVPDYEGKFLKIKPGEDHYYTSKRAEDLGKDFYSTRGVRPSLITKEKKVFVEGIFGSDEELENINFPDSVLSAAMDEVLTTVLRLQPYVDKTDDGDPNQKPVKEKLAR